MKMAGTSVALMWSRMKNDVETSRASESSGASGIIINDDWCLSHGSLLHPRTAEDTKLRRFFDGLVTGRFTILPAKIRDDLRVRIFQRQDERSELLSKAESSRDDAKSTMIRTRNRILESTGHIAAAWKCSLLKKTLNELMLNWSFDDNRHVAESSMTIFLMISMNCEKPEITKNPSIGVTTEGIINFLTKFIDDGHLTMAERGSSLEITSTPFGNLVFLDSLSRGVTSNVLGYSGCLTMTDANTVPGSQGAPVHVINRDGTTRNLCGMVIAPLSWCRGEWVDYTFAASLLPCLRTLILDGRINKLQPIRQLHQHPSKDRHFIDNSETNIADLLDDCLVTVRCGNGWGTGIIVDVTTGTIITCAHVVHKAPDSPIKVVLRRDHDEEEEEEEDEDDEATYPRSLGLISTRAKLVYRTLPGRAYDVAVLQIDPRIMKITSRSIKFDDRRPIVRGETVASVGFPFWSDGKATMTRGCVSSITEFMLQTTCCIQSGSSGGPVVRWSTGEMLGMIVCNAVVVRTKTNEKKQMIYPRLNVAVPINVLMSPIVEYLRTNDAKVLEVLDSKDSRVQEMWNFQLFPSSKI